MLSLVLRVYKLDLVPPSISWDEAAVGYNAWSIANYGRDEYGKFLPLYFNSFGEGKNPVHIYFTAISVKILGLNELSTRLPSAIFGVLTILALYYLVRLLFLNEAIALLSAFFLSISPFNIHFSRFNHEANFTLFFFIVGLYLFLLSIKKGRKLLPFSLILFCISFLSYNAAKVFVPVAVVFLFVLYIKEIKKYPKQLLLSIFCIILFCLLLFKNPELLGGTRANQTIQGKSEIEKTYLYKATNNEILGRVNLILTQYSWHFMPEFLFITGDKNPKLSSQTGEFYKIDALLLILGIAYLIFKRSKEGILVLVWVLSGPLPSSLVGEAPHAGRSTFMMGSWHIISALGLYFLIGFMKNPLFKKITVIFFLLIFAYSLKGYLTYYHGEYLSRYAIEWQYGMKQVVEFTKLHPEYNQVNVTDIRSQPYIFFLFYLQTPLDQYLNTALLNNSQSKSYSNISSFDKYYFGSWNIAESFPSNGVLYVLGPSEYDGLRYKSQFGIKKIVYYPNNTIAFYLVSQ